MSLQQSLDREINIILSDDSLTEEEKDNQIIEFEREAREWERCENDDYFKKLETGEL